MQHALCQARTLVCKLVMGHSKCRIRLSLASSLEKLWQQVLNDNLDELFNGKMLAMYCKHVVSSVWGAWSLSKSGMARCSLC